MSPDERTALFLQHVCEHIHWPPYRARVRRELTDHILSRAEYLQNERGFSHEEAVAQAIRLLGDPGELGRGLRQARRTCRLTATILLWVCIACCAAYLLLHLLR